MTSSRVIAVANLKGGTGKTLTAVNLAAALTEGGRTLLVDADPQGSACAWAALAGAEFPCAVVACPTADIHLRLPTLAAAYTHVVIDTPPGHVDVVRSALLASDLVLLTMPPTAMDLNRLHPTLELLADVERQHPVRLQVLITRSRAGTRLGRAVRSLLETLEVPVLDSEVPLREAYAAGFGAAPVPHVDYTAVLEEIVR